MELLEKLQRTQCEMKAPKNLYNSFGKYHYRNAEGILEALKPFEDKYKFTVTVLDDMVEIGGRVYCKSTVRVHDQETTMAIEGSAFARESADKKGMDDSQITGTASSYARKYALNGVFLLDDTKDADSDEYASRTTGEPMEQHEKTRAMLNEPAEDTRKKAVRDICDKHKIDIKSLYAANGITEETATKEQVTGLINALKRKYKE